MTGLVVGTLSDCLSLKGVPAGAASAALSKLINKRHAMLREIILSEIRQGNFNNVDQDDLTSVFFRLIRDAEEGVARSNLHLLARVINGMAEKNELRAPTFLRYANAIASLSKEEIIVFGIMAKHRDRVKGLPVEDSEGNISYRDPEEEELEAAVSHYPYVQQSLVRTGLITFTVNAQQADNFDHEGIHKPDHPLAGLIKLRSKVDYHLTPLARDLLKYTDFLIPEREAA